MPERQGQSHSTIWERGYLLQFLGPCSHSGEERPPSSGRKGRQHRGFFRFADMQRAESWGQTKPEMGEDRENTLSLT